MTFITEGRLRARARMSAEAAGLAPKQQLSRQSRLESSRYDIFLSQALKDDEIVLGIYTILTEDLGLTVFCDWTEPSFRDHAGTRPDDAAYIVSKMNAAAAMVFIDSENAETSSWMSWEIGWFHGAKGRICVLPVVADGSGDYRRREYLGLYPTAEADDTHTFRVSVPLLKVVDRFSPGTILGIATSLPISVWISLAPLPNHFLPS